MIAALVVLVGFVGLGFGAREIWRITKNKKPSVAANAVALLINGYYTLVCAESFLKESQLLQRSIILAVGGIFFLEFAVLIFVLAHCLIKTIKTKEGE